MMVPSEYVTEIQLHQKLYLNAAWQLGEIHWYIQKADTEMDSRSYIENDNEKSMELPKLTSFGEEVGTDRIHWYVYKKEKDSQLLKRKTEETLVSSQILKEASLKLKNKEPTSYSDLIKTILDFTIEHAKEINDLHDYVKWLFQQDVIAPAILYTYRVWGSTRLSDRMIKIRKSAVLEDSSTVKKCVEIVLGLRSWGGYTLGQVYSDLASDIAESIDDEYQGSIIVPKSRVIKRTIIQVLEELATYFEFFRNSLRNIIIDVDKRNDQMSILYKESFWKDFIKKAKHIKVETELWDFKRTLEMWHTTGAEKDKSRVTFCGDVASFANTQGGLLIIGITDEVPRTIVGVPDLENKMKHAKEAIGKHSTNKSNFTHFQQVNIKDENQNDQTCLVIAIAQTKEVVGIQDINHSFLYLIRSETGVSRSDSKSISDSKRGVTQDNYAFVTHLQSLLQG